MKHPESVPVREVSPHDLYVFAPEGYCFVDMYGHRFTDIMLVKREDE